MKRNITLKIYKDNRRFEEHKNISSIYNNQTYTMILNDVKTSLSKDLLIRENDEFKFTLDIKNKTALYLLKETNTKFDIIVEKINIIIKKSNIIIEYKLESDEDIIKIELIEEEEKNE